MSWGHAVSKDLLHWDVHHASPALRPDQPYDAEGVFTGCWIPQADDDKTAPLALAYSSVKQLPFHWSTPPYPRNAAGLSIATSADGGNTWTKSARNPILHGEPEHLTVTGWRDPYVTQSDAIDALRGTSALYALLSGGIQDVGPTTFLYEVSPADPEKWTYLNPLVDVDLRFQPSDKWAGNYGVNWECTNLVLLRSGAVEKHFLLLSAEGDVERDHVAQGTRPGAPKRSTRSQLWMSGRLEGTDAGVKFRHEHGGFLDHGSYYAANTFHDPKADRRVIHGWVPEEDVPIEYAHAKGWNGAMTLPRELFLLKVHNVAGTLGSKLDDIYPYDVVQESDGSKTVYTLGIRPIVEVDKLYGTPVEAKTPLALPSAQDAGPKRLFEPTTTAWELRATIAVTRGCETVGFHINHSADLKTRTSVYFSAVTETIVIDRHASTSDTRVNTCPDAGPFTLFKFGGPEGSDAEALEQLELRIVSDGNILEVFANDRFALATMVYSDPGETLISAYASGDMESATYKKVTLRQGQ